MKSKAVENWPIWAVLALALALRLANTISMGDEYYANFLSDASTFRLWASRIAAGLQYGTPVFPMGPLYPYFLALCLAAGFSFYSVLFIQAFLGTAVVYNIYLVAGRIFDKNAGLIAAFMAAIYGPFVFYDGLLLSESLQLFLTSLAMTLMIPRRKKKVGWIRYIFAGVMIGLTALGRGTILIFPFLATIFWIYRYFHGAEKRKGEIFSRAAPFLAGIICGIMPATIHNVANGEFVPISSNFGINFYIGNNPHATGSYDEPRGLNLSSDFTGRQIAERESEEKLKSSEVSEFWSNRAIKFIYDKPLEFVAGLFNKVWLCLWNFDIPQAESIQIHKRFSPVFQVLPTGYWFVLIPGIIGMIITPKDESGLLLMFLLISSIAGGMIFFVIGRFKLIGSIALLIFAGGGVRDIYRLARERNRVRLVHALILTAIALLVLFLPRSIDRGYKIASAFDNVGISYYFKDRLDEAIKWYRLAVEIEPGHSGALNNIGGYFYTKQRPDSAIYYFRRSIESDSTDDKPYQNLGRTFLNMGMVDSAYYYYQMAKSLSPYGLDADRALKELEDLISGKMSPGDGVESFDVLYGMAEKYAAQRKFDLAERYYESALRQRPDDIRTLNNLGFTFQAQGKFDEAIKMFQRTIELAGSNAVAYNNLASVFYRKGLPDSAEVLWERALALDPENRQIRANLDFLRKNKDN